MRNPLAKSVSFKPEEISARSYVDRLILEKLTELESVVKLSELADQLSNDGIGLATVRSLLASNPERFAYHERRWIPAARLLSEGKPFAESLQLFLNRFGGPMSISALASELSFSRLVSIEVAENSIRRFASRDRGFVLTANDEIALAGWGFIGVDELVPRALGLNGVTQEQVDEAAIKLKKVDWRSDSAAEDALKAGAPMSAKVIGAVAYVALYPADPRKQIIFDSYGFFRRLLEVPGYILSADGAFYAESEAKKWVSAAIRLAEKLIPTIELDDAAPIEVKAEDVEKLIGKILANPTSTTATKLLEENYEITPSNKTFPDDFANIMVALKGSKAVQWVGGDRFRKAGDIPDYIHELPEPFQFTQSTVKDEEGEYVDVELTDEGLSSSLRKLLSHPLATDVNDEDIQPQPKQMAETCRLVLKSIHRELGTFPMCQFPTGWLATDPNIQEYILQMSSGRELQVWGNTQDRLLFGFIDWWLEQNVESGAVFTITRTGRQNVFDFEWMDQPDPVVYISSQRMEELRQIGVEAEGKSTLELLIATMAHWPKGADYLTILAEMNVVRRTTRRLVASLLSSYQCFYQRSGSPVWHFDGKKVDQGFDKTKRKFIKK